MKRLLFLFFWLASASSLICHPLHLSVTNISRDQSGLDISLRTFLKDWETAYFHFHGTLPDPDFRSETEGERNPWFDSYLLKHFRLSSGHYGKSLDLQVGSVLIAEEGSMVVKLTAELPENTDSLWIHNTLLTDIFADQKNLVIFGSENNEVGIEFDARKKHHAVLLE